MTEAAGHAPVSGGITPALSGLRQALSAVSYVDAVLRLANHAPAHQLRHVARAHGGMRPPSHVPAADWLAVSVFFLGQPAAEVELRALLGDAVEPLVALGLLERAEPGALRSGRYVLVPVQGLPFVVSRLAHERTAPGAVAAYFGLDTLELASYALERRAESVLDLGCGAGIVGILAALSGAAGRVTGTDVSAEAVQVARMNAALHGARYDARQGDLYRSVEGERFDLIVADPPSVPVPDGLAFDVYGRGGPYGDALLRRVFEGAAAHLVPGGRAFAITELQASPEHIPFLGWLREFCASRPGHRCNVRVCASRRIPADWHTSLGNSAHLLPGWQGPAGAGAEWSAFVVERGIAFGYWVHVELEYRPELPSVCDVDWAFARATPDTRPTCGLGRAAFEERFRAFYNHPMEAFGDGLERFIDGASGERSVRALADEFGRGTEACSYWVELTSAFAQIGLLDIGERDTACR